MFLLDTNVLSELRKCSIGKGNISVETWAQSVDAEDLYLSVMTVFEIELGILKLERHDKAQSTIYRKWLNDVVLPEFHERLLPIDKAISLKAASLHIPDPRSDRDALIAATAIVHRMTVVTRNVTDFRGMSVTLCNPWGLDQK